MSVPRSTVDFFVSLTSVKLREPADLMVGVGTNYRNMRGSPLTLARLDALIGPRGDDGCNMLDLNPVVLWEWMRGRYVMCMASASTSMSMFGDQRVKSFIS